MNIDALKSVISARSGIAASNRFEVTISAPSVSAERDVTILCDSCTLPGRTITSFDYQFLQNSFKIPNGFIVEEVTLGFILTNDYFVKKYFDSWMSSVVDFTRYRAKYLNEYAGTVNINQLKKSSKGDDKKVYGVRLDNAWPTSVGPITMDNAMENTPQKLLVTIAYQNFEVIT